MSEEQTPVEEPTVEQEIPLEALETEQVETPEEGQEEATTSEDTQEKPTGFKKRIGELTRKNYEFQQQVEQERQQAEEYRRQLEEVQRSQQTGEEPPRLDQYTDETEYYKAVETWSKSQLDSFQKQQQEAAEQQKVFQEQQAFQMKLNQKVADATEKHPDFMVKISNPNLRPLNEINPAAFEALVESDQFADVANYLASNPEEWYSLGTLSPVQAVKQIARLEDKFSKPASTTTPITPPTTVGGKAEVEVDLDNVSDAEYERLWKAGKV